MACCLAKATGLPGSDTPSEIEFLPTIQHVKNGKRVVYSIRKPVGEKIIGPSRFEKLISATKWTLGHNT